MCLVIQIVTALSRVLPPTTGLTTPSFSNVRLLHCRNRIAFQSRFEIYRRDRTQTRFPILADPSGVSSPRSKNAESQHINPVSHKINPHPHVFLEKVATVYYFCITIQYTHHERSSYDPTKRYDINAR
jgi:hypothetical protein